MHLPRALFIASACLLGCQSPEPDPTDDTAAQTDDTGAQTDDTDDDSGDEPAAIGDRVLVVGPRTRSPGDIAVTLQALIDADGLDEGTQVEALQLPAPASQYISQMGLITAWYQQSGRTARMESFTGDWDHVLLIENTWLAALLPEFTFEGLRTLGGHFQDQGSQVHLVLEPPINSSDYDFETAVAHSYRAADGTGTAVIPAGLAMDQIAGATDWDLVAATTAYASLRGVSASRVETPPEGTDAETFTALADQVHELVQVHLETEHYTGAFQGPVQVQDIELPDSYGVLIVGTSSERGYLSMMKVFLDERAVTLHEANAGKCNDYRDVDADCLSGLSERFANADYVSLYARSYSVTRADIQAAGGGAIQPQLYDRHWDATQNDGLGALDDIEARMAWALLNARDNDLAFIPHHLFWARYQQANPSADLLRDGVHATDDVQYGLASMSWVSATGQTSALDGLSDQRAAIAEIAEACVREWSTLQESP